MTLLVGRRLALGHSGNEKGLEEKGAYYAHVFARPIWP
jgi:hypothetical protein